MSQRVFSVVGGVCLAAWLVVPGSPLIERSLAQSSNPNPAEQQAPAGQDAAKESQKIDEYAEAQRALNGPAGNPECVWLGRRVVSLLWRDDLDTAFRHLDLYDRFGCPSGHIQAAFRCLVLHSNTIDPKTADSLNGRVQACWINPSLEVLPAPRRRRLRQPRRRRPRRDSVPVSGETTIFSPKCCCSHFVVLNLPLPPLV